jgi:hypothetical protein
MQAARGSQVASAYLIPYPVLAFLSLCCAALMIRTSSIEARDHRQQCREVFGMQDHNSRLMSLHQVVLSMMAPMYPSGIPAEYCQRLAVMPQSLPQRLPQARVVQAAPVMRSQQVRTRAHQPVHQNNSAVLPSAQRHPLYQHPLERHGPTPGVPASTSTTGLQGQSAASVLRSGVVEGTVRELVSLGPTNAATAAPASHGADVIEIE